LITLFVFVGLLVGAICREINKKTKIPYTPMLLVVGILMGGYRNYLSYLGQSINIVEHINPHGILTIFIPTLLFESASTCDWHIFRRNLGNVMILAFPGVIIGSFLLGICLKYLLYTELDWWPCLMMGSIVSATDPVAVVALLKSLGASKKFQTIIEGESLLNDGTAMVFFILFAKLTKGESYTINGVLINLVLLIVGGPILGLIFGYIANLWLKRIINDDVLVITISFVMCYLLFFLSENLKYSVSGILALVTLGFFMSAIGRTSISQDSITQFHTV